jgi:hypothetical protein
MKKRTLILAIAPVAALFLACAAGTVFYNNRHIYEENYSRPNPKMAAMVSETDGWLPGDDRLALPRGGHAHILYDFYKAADHAVFLTFRTAHTPGISVALSLHVRDQHPSLGTMGPGEQRTFDLTPLLADHAGVFRIRFDAELAPNAPAPTAHPFEGFVITLDRPRTVHWPALLFFAAFASAILAACALALVLGVRNLAAAPSKDISGDPKRLDQASSQDPTRTDSPAPRWIARALWVSLLIGFVIVALHPGWRERKRFDDVRAISNAAAVLDTGFDVDSLYFRGQTRPGFVAYAVPLVRLHRQTILRVQKTPADFYREIWEEYDRDNATFGQCLQLELSVYGMVQGGLCLLAIAAIGRLLGFRREALPVAVVVAAVFLYRALAIDITQTFTLFINLCAVLAWLLWQRQLGSRRLLLPAAAFLLGAAILTKTSTITSVIPIGLHQLLLVFRAETRRQRKRLLLDFALYWLIAAGVVLIWFQFFLDGVWTAYSRFWGEHTAAQGLQEYESTGPGPIASAFRQVFGWGGLALVAASAALLALRKIKVHAFVGFWILGASAVLVLPYIFPRFFQYYIAPLSLFVGAGIAEGIRWGSREERRKKNSDGEG